MDKIIQKLTNMEAWIDFHLFPPAEFKTKPEHMRFAAEVMNRCLYLLRIGVASAPDAKTADTGYAKSKAIIVGYMVQLTKLYEGALIQICGTQPELTRLFFPPILEIRRNMEDLITASDESDPNSASTSHLFEQKMFREVEDKAKTYTPDCIHRNWDDIRLCHLIQRADSYVPDLSLDEPNPHLGYQLTQICLETLFVYLKWNKSDPEGLITSVVMKLSQLNTALDNTYENTLGE